MQDFVAQETLKATVDSLVELGLCNPKKKTLDQNLIMKKYIAPKL